MTRFKLLQKSATKFQIVCGADVVGSICVEAARVPDLLKHWAGDKQLSASPRMSISGMKLAKAKPMSRQALLRGCL